jgi:hypothetical protein
MQQVQSFVAIDGAHFTSEQECLAHEAYIRTASRIDDFFVALSPSDRRESEYRRVLAAYEQFCATYVEPELIAGEPDCPDDPSSLYDEDLG